MKDSTDKSKLQDKSALLREIAIIDYVADNQSAAVRRNFENAMQQDESLREAVAAEQQFRAGMQEVGQLEPVSMSNFDALLARVDEYEKSDASCKSGLIDNAIGQEGFTSSAVADFSTQTSSVLKSVSPRWNTRYSIAASIAVMAIAFGGFYSSMLAPNFDTLSSEPASAEVKFAELSEQGRLAKVVLSDKFAQSDVSDILKDYELKTFESGAPDNTLYVFADEAISEKNLANMKADIRIQQIDVFTVNNGIQKQ